MSYDDPDTISTADMESFIAKLRDERPTEVNSINPATGETDTHGISYEEGESGPVAVIGYNLPDNCYVILTDGTEGPIAGVVIPLA